MAGFLRTETALIQTMGRAARHINGQVIMYADKISQAMSLAIKETERRRKIQEKYNKDNNIIPKGINS
jgi:excinuclease ABC subunit B